MLLRLPMLTLLGGCATGDTGPDPLDALAAAVANQTRCAEGGLLCEAMTNIGPVGPLDPGTRVGLMVPCPVDSQLDDARGWSDADLVGLAIHEGTVDLFEIRYTGAGLTRMFAGAHMRLGVAQCFDEAGACDVEIPHVFSDLGASPVGAHLDEHGHWVAQRGWRGHWHVASTDVAGQPWLVVAQASRWGSSCPAVALFPAAPRAFEER